MWMIPRRNETLTAEVRSLTFSFAKMLRRCTPTVSSRTWSSSAIFPIPHPFGHKLDDLDLARRQRRRSGPLIEKRPDMGSQGRSAGADLADYANQILGQRVLEQAGRGSSFEGAVHVFVALIHREHDNPRLVIQAPDGANRLEAGDPWEPQIHQRHIRMAGSKDVERFLAGRRRTDDLHIGLALDDDFETFTHDRMIVHAKYANALL